MGVSSWSLVRLAHVLAAKGWVGGQLFLSVIVLPVLRQPLAPELRGSLIHRAATRFAVVVATALVP